MHAGNTHFNHFAIFQLFFRILHGHEPVCVQALFPKAPAHGFDMGVIIAAWTIPTSTTGSIVAVLVFFGSQLA